MAAGRSTRTHPLTATRPKPLVPDLGPPASRASARSTRGAGGRGPVGRRFPAGPDRGPVRRFLPRNAAPLRGAGAPARHRGRAPRGAASRQRTLPRPQRRRLLSPRRLAGTRVERSWTPRLPGEGPAKPRGGATGWRRRHRHRRKAEGSAARTRGAASGDTASRRTTSVSSTTSSRALAASSSSLTSSFVWSRRAKSGRRRIERFWLPITYSWDVLQTALFLWEDCPSARGSSELEGPIHLGARLTSVDESARLVGPIAIGSGAAHRRFGRRRAIDPFRRCRDRRRRSGGGFRSRQRSLGGRFGENREPPRIGARDRRQGEESRSRDRAAGRGRGGRRLDRGGRGRAGGKPDLAEPAGRNAGAPGFVLHPLPVPLGRRELLFRLPRQALQLIDRVDDGIAVRVDVSLVGTQEELLEEPHPFARGRRSGRARRSPSNAIPLRSASARGSPCPDRRRPAPSASHPGISASSTEWLGRLRLLAAFALRRRLLFLVSRRTPPPR